MGYIQQAITTATRAICLMTDTLLKQKSDEKLDIKQLIKTGTDAIALPGHVNNEISQQRKFPLIPNLKTEYQRLCTQSTPVTADLFGNDINKAMTNAKQVSRLGRKVGNYQNGPSKKNNNGAAHPYWRQKGGKNFPQKRSLYNGNNYKKNNGFKNRPKK